MGDRGSEVSGKPDLVLSRDRAGIAAMFDAISTRYDLMNALMTLGQDRRWRRLAIRAAHPGRGDRALDVATGTGDMARELAKAVGPTGSVLGIDISRSMLDLAWEKTSGLPVRFLVCDVLEIELKDEFDVAVVAFGLRNFSDRAEGVARMARSLTAGGRLVVLELTPSRSRLKPAIDVYEQWFIPKLGRMISGQQVAYSYLPESVSRSLTAGQIEELLRSSGLEDVRVRSLNFGTVAIVSGQKR